MCNLAPYLTCVCKAVKNNWMTENLSYLLYAIKHWESCSGYRASVVTIGISELNCLNDDGSPTLIYKDKVPSKILSIVASENVVFSTGSGIPNSKPGIDVYRYDKNDVCPINRDHYSLFFDLTKHPNFKKWISTASVTANSANLALMSQWTLVKKEPIDPNNHHLTYKEACKLLKKVSR